MGLFILVTVLTLIIAVLIVLIVLVQNSKGGGLASNFASSNQYMGVRKTGDFLEKSTWSLAGAMLVLVLLSSAIIPKYKNNTEAADTELKGTIQDIPIQTTTPFEPGQNANQNNAGNNQNAGDTAK